MNKLRLVTVIAVVGVIGVLTISLPKTLVRANHCHPEHSKAAAPPTPVNKPARTSAPNLSRRSTITRVPGTYHKPAGSDISSVKKSDEGSETLSFEEVYSREFPMAIVSLGEAIKAIESGDRQTEIAELTKAVEKLMAVYKALGAGARPKFANNLICPIMGSSIDMNVVEDSLTRDYKGRKVAFCCPGCPSAWDKLSDPQKQAKIPGAKF